MNLKYFVKKTSLLFTELMLKSNYISYLTEIIDTTRNKRLKFQLEISKTFIEQSNS